jgi:hypothetical protein
VIALCLSLSAFSAYLICNDLVETDFVVSDLRFENPDPDGDWNDGHFIAKMFISEILSFALSFAAYRLSQLPTFSSQPLSFNKRVSVLRC